MNLNKNEFGKLMGDKEFDNCLFLGGGTDVDPDLYNKERHPMTNNPDIERDQRCLKAVIKAIGQNKPVIGICRGSQFLGVFNGNILHQHCEGEEHGETDITARTSDLGWEDIEERDLGGWVDNFRGHVTHHQTLHIVRPWTCRLLARSNGGQRGIDNDGKPYPIGIVPQVVYYPQFNHLGIQFHAEWMAEDSIARRWLRKIIKTCLNIKDAC